MISCLNNFKLSSYSVNFKGQNHNKDKNETTLKDVENQISLIKVREKEVQENASKIKARANRLQHKADKELKETTHLINKYYKNNEKNENINFRLAHHCPGFIIMDEKNNDIVLRRTLFNAHTKEIYSITKGCKNIKLLPKNANENYKNTSPRGNFYKFDENYNFSDNKLAWYTENYTKLNNGDMFYDKYFCFKDDELYLYEDGCKKTTYAETYKNQYKFRDDGSLKYYKKGSNRYDNNKKMYPEIIKFDKNSKLSYYTNEDTKANNISYMNGYFVPTNLK